MKQEITHTFSILLSSIGMNCKYWSPSEFESIADKIGKDGEILSVACEEYKKVYKIYRRPCVCSV